jgi:hypothetical protein
MAAYDATTVLESAEKFNIFHQRDFRKSANINEDSSPAEYPVVATSHSQQQSGVVPKTISQPVNQVLWQANSKKTACDVRIVHDALDLFQTAPRNFRVNMNKPKDVAVRSDCASIHLYRPIRLAYDKLITKTARDIGRAVGTSPIRNDNLRVHCPLAQMRKAFREQ